jgi:hypothetical protein
MQKEAAFKNSSYMHPIAPAPQSKAHFEPSPPKKFARSPMHWGAGGNYAVMKQKTPKEDLYALR